MATGMVLSKLGRDKYEAQHIHNCCITMPPVYCSHGDGSRRGCILYIICKHYIRAYLEFNGNNRETGVVE